MENKPFVSVETFAIDKEDKFENLSVYGNTIPPGSVFEGQVFHGCISTLLDRVMKRSAVVAIIGTLDDLKLVLNFKNTLDVKYVFTAEPVSIVNGLYPVVTFPRYQLEEMLSASLSMLLTATVEISSSGKANVSLRKLRSLLPKSIGSISSVWQNLLKRDGVFMFGTVFENEDSSTSIKFGSHKVSGFITDSSGSIREQSNHQSIVSN